MVPHGNCIECWEMQVAVHVCMALDVVAMHCIAQMHGITMDSKMLQIVIGCQLQLTASQTSSCMRCRVREPNKHSETEPDVYRSVGRKLKFKLATAWRRANRHGLSLHLGCLNEQLS